MIVKDIIDEDFINYKKPSMFILTPKCSFKCCKEAGNEICQNMDMVKQPDIEIDNSKVIKRYLNNSITSAIVFGGLEPLDTFKDVYLFIKELRNECLDDVVIYTGYYPEEIKNKIDSLSKFENIIVKFGRFIPGTEKKLDPVLGIELYEPQWAERI
jgi:hypothetical protein